MFLVFKCLECGYEFEFLSDNDPTSSSGCCKNCGDANWIVVDNDGNIVY